MIITERAPTFSRLGCSSVWIVLCLILAACTSTDTIAPTTPLSPALAVSNPSPLPTPTPQPFAAPAIKSLGDRTLNDAIIQAAQEWEHLGITHYRVTVHVESPWLTITVTTTVKRGRIIEEICTTPATASQCASSKAIITPLLISSR